MSTSETYRRFAALEARGNSPCYERWAEGIAQDEEILQLIEELPPGKRQPNLVLGAARFTGAEPSDFAAFRDWLLTHWPSVRSVAMVRATQTNEIGRCAVLLPLLAALPQPLALIEVGASAGLCLFPDRFSYRYGETWDIHPRGGPGATVLACAANGNMPLPHAMPAVIWRSGIDLNPLDVEDGESVRWLEALVWPEQQARRDRLAAGIAVARADPPRIVRGDLNANITGLVREALEALPESQGTVVVFHSAVLAYLDAASREAFASTMRQLPCRWISNEAPSVLGAVKDRLPGSYETAARRFVLALDEIPVAYAGPHGQSLDWFG